MQTSQSEVVSSMPDNQAMVEIAIEGWRFTRVFLRVLAKLDAGEAQRYVNQARYFQKKIDDVLATNGLKLVTLEGKPYDTGMAVTALNVGDFSDSDQLFVDQMVEPVIVGPEGLVRSGVVILAKVNA